MRIDRRLRTPPLRLRPWPAAPVLVALALALVGLLGAPRTAAALEATGPVATEVFARVSPSIPVIETPAGHGTGFMLDETHILTAAHVVGDFEIVSARFSDGATFGTARVVARDLLVDMAVIEIPGRRPVPTKIMAPPTVIGSELYVLGFPGNTRKSPAPLFSRGLLSHTVEWDTAGMHYIRTDASAEPGTSGGPVLDAAGDIIGMVQFGSSSDRYLIAASAIDLQARALRHLRGEDVDGIARRVPRGEQSSDAEVRLNGVQHPEESFFITPTKKTAVEITLNATSIESLVTVALVRADGAWVGSTLLTAARTNGTIRGNLDANERYWLSISAARPAHVTVDSNITLSRFADPDEARATLGRTVGMLDHFGDVDCRPIMLRTGQKFTARAESVTSQPLLYLVSPAGEIVTGDRREIEAARGDHIETSLTVPSTGTFQVCVGAAGLFGDTGGYILVLAASAPPPIASSAGTFATSVARLTTARSENTTIALRDGRVLTIGGTDAAGKLLDTAEIFDPKTRATATIDARDVVPRRVVSATLLRDGRVLVLGGITATGVTNTASILNPADGTWRRAASPLTPRAFGETVLLDDGRVLVATGIDRFGSIADAEIYDPVADRFTRTGSMTVPRSGLFSSKLADGRVLIAGGGDARGIPNRSAEIYDPKTGTFTATGDLVVARSNHSSTLLPSGLVLLVGGATPWEDLSSTEIYDPATGTFRAGPTMQFGRNGPSASMLPDGRVLIAGGAYRPNLISGQYLDIGSAELYEPSMDRFVAAGALEVARDQHGVALPDGSVVFVGGTAGDRTLDSIEVYAGTNTRPGPGTFARLPMFSTDGVALVIFEGGSLAQLEASARAADATGAWLQDVTGAPQLMVVGGPAFLGDGLRGAFPQGIAPSTVVTLTR